MLFQAYNNIIWGNEADEDGKDIYIYDDWDNNGVGAMAEIFYNDFEGLSSQVGDDVRSGNNISQNPLLVNPGAGDFHLASGSPCIDRASNSAPGLPDDDFEGDPRVLGAGPDMGADESGGSSPVNNPPVIDSFTAEPSIGDAPLTVTLTCQAHDPDGDIAEFMLVFGDGDQETNQSGVFFHIYESSGNFTAVCQVQDEEGMSVTSDIGITVNTASNEEKKGDVSGDGSIDIVDALFL